jgi:hypothetical protein
MMTEWCSGQLSLLIPIQISIQSTPFLTVLVEIVTDVFVDPDLNVFGRPRIIGYTHFSVQEYVA